MPFSIDFLDDGRVLEWEATADDAVATERDDYTPRFYVAPRDPDADLDLTTLQSVYDQHPDVVDDEKSSRDRVALAHEEIGTYDASYYETQLVRAVESVLLPLGWDRLDIRRRLAETREVELTEFTAPRNG